jgi:hypothetical protein
VLRRPFVLSDIFHGVKMIERARRILRKGEERTVRNEQQEERKERKNEARKERGP